MFLHFDDRWQWLEQFHADCDQESIRETTIRICQRRELEGGTPVIAIYASYVRDPDECIVRHRRRVLVEDKGVEVEADQIREQLREDAAGREISVAGGLYQAI